MHAPYIYPKRFRIDGAPLARPDVLDEVRIVGRDLALHSERVVAVQVVLPPVAQHKVEQLWHVAQALCTMMVQ